MKRGEIERERELTLRVGELVWLLLGRSLACCLAIEREDCRYTLLHPAFDVVHGVSMSSGCPEGFPKVEVWAARGIKRNAMILRVANLAEVCYKAALLWLKQ